MGQQKWMILLKSQFSYRQHRVFKARSKLWSTSQRHTVRNRLQSLLFLVGIAGTTGMNMSVENNILHLLCLHAFSQYFVVIWILELWFHKLYQCLNRTRLFLVEIVYGGNFHANKQPILDYWNFWVQSYIKYKFKCTKN